MNLMSFVERAESTSLPDREVIDALVHPAHAAPSPQLRQALTSWRGPYYWSDESDGRHLILTSVRPRQAERWWLHWTLFVLTFVSVTLSGAVLSGRLPYYGVLGLLTSLAHPSARFWSTWASGLSFSIPLLSILLAHELGHYIASRRHGVNASPPFFIPAPLISIIGTLGAFIRIRTILSDRRQLLDIGVAGPFAGFAVALPVLIAGMSLSTPLPTLAPGYNLLLNVGSDTVPIGSSLLTNWVRHFVIGGSGGVALSPLAFAGWIGMFVTMLNLLPLAQLDGGHALYAAAPKLQPRLALLFWIALGVLGWFKWQGWLVWAVLIVLMSRGRLAHPAVLNGARPLSPARVGLAILSLMLFVVTFVPKPF
ncbi:MAG TPA: site-2 protease family protein [Gemmatimonadales bacterium]|nr:site-2 protease family protein [Gemmatimonadales bacterium]